MANNDLVLTTHAQEEEHDALLASIGELARPSSRKAEPAPKVIKNRYRSRFFFHVSESFVEAVEKRKKTMAKTGMEHVDDEITKRLAAYKVTMPKVMSVNIEKVREFFLTEIAPRTVSIGAGADQARDVVQRLLGSAIDGTQFSKFERMNAAAVDILMAKFIAKQFKLPAADAQRLLAIITPQVPVTVPVPLPTKEGQSDAPPPYESRHAKAKRKRKEEGPERRKTTDRA